MAGRAQLSFDDGEVASGHHVTPIQSDLAVGTFTDIPFATIVRLARSECTFSCWTHVHFFFTVRNDMVTGETEPIVLSGLNPTFRFRAGNSLWAFRSHNKFYRIKYILYSYILMSIITLKLLIQICEFLVHFSWFPFTLTTVFIHSGKILFLISTKIFIESFI